LPDDILSFLDSFVDWAHQGLLQSDEAQEYLRGRGISSDQWTRHRLGFTIGEFEPEIGKDSHHKPDICKDKEIRSQWCDSCRYVRWSTVWETVEENTPKVPRIGRRIAGSIVFPLTSYSGSIVGFQVRSLVEKSYDSFLVTRRPEGYFFGVSSSLESIWKSKEAILVEGPGDHLIMERLVAPNVLGITTSSPSMAQVRFLRRFVKRVILCLDMDQAGRKGVHDFCLHYGNEFDSILTVKYPCPGPKDKDPGDFWKKVGDSTFSRHFRTAM
jgi:DNA primase